MNVNDVKRSLVLEAIRTRRVEKVGEIGQAGNFSIHRTGKCKECGRTVRETDLQMGTCERCWKLHEEEMGGSWEGVEGA